MNRIAMRGACRANSRISIAEPRDRTGHFGGECTLRNGGAFRDPDRRWAGSLRVPRFQRRRACPAKKAAMRVGVARPPGKPPLPLYWDVNPAEAILKTAVAQDAQPAPMHLR